METKKEIRKRVLAQRRALDREAAALASQVICRKVTETAVFDYAEDICLYMPINNEVDATLLAEAAEASGKGVWIPKVTAEGEGGEMRFNAYDRGENMAKGAYGIKESASEEFLEPNEKTLIIMPGAVFTPWRDRIGYGGGFYDRYLEAHPMCMTIALCYDFQIVDEIPTERHDVKPDYIISETSIYR